jgi:hypothetical protein
MRLSRMTTRRWMITVALVAILLAIVIYLMRWLSFSFTFGTPTSIHRIRIF